MKQKNRLYLVLICGVWFAIGWVLRGYLGNGTLSTATESALLAQVRQLLKAEYYGELPSDRALTYAAIRGMLRRTGDPYAALLEPEVSQRFEADFAGQTGVIGLVPAVKDGQMVVEVVFSGDPADQAGLKPGDVLLEVDGVQLDPYFTASEVGLLIRGPVGTPVHLVVQRGDQVLQFDPVRQERVVVEQQLLEDGVGYVAQYTFTANAADEMKTALQALLAEHPRAIIWDLRNNGGGSMQTTQQVLSYFIQEGLLFTVESKDRSPVRFEALKGDFHTDLPLVVLIGPHTFSAAETSAAAVAELQRGVLIGEPTYGKGTVYATYPVGDCRIELTNGRWLGPQGTWYNQQGVAPTIVAHDDESSSADEVLEVALQYIRDTIKP